MFMNMSHFQPKAGQEAKFKEMFVDEILSITLNAKGLISADIVVATDGTITNLERWESEAAWKDLVADMTSTRLRADRFEVDDIAIDDNTISITTLNEDLLLNANGIGSVVIDELGFKDSSIINRTSNGITYFRNSGNGYFKIEGNKGFVVPVGLDTERPTPPYRELGMVRYNTDQSYLEIWDGVSWVSVAGSSGAITFTAAENLAVEYILTLG